MASDKQLSEMFAQARMRIQSALDFLAGCEQACNAETESDPQRRIKRMMESDDAEYERLKANGK